MKRASMFVLAAAVALVSSGAQAAVNCEQVRRYAQTGRTAEQIAETMIADEDEVKKCLEGMEKAPPLAGSAPAGGSGAASGGGEKNQ
jgi:hypothetical protein